MVDEYKQVKALERENLRDHMTGIAWMSLQLLHSKSAASHRSSLHAGVTTERRADSFEPPRVPV